MAKTAAKSDDKPAAKPKNQDKATEEIARIVRAVLEGRYLSRWAMFKINFIRGTAFGIGSFFGATIVVFIVLWLLSIFSDLPFIGDIADNLRSAIQQETPNRN